MENKEQSEGDKKTLISSAYDTLTLLSNWMLEVAAFILLPLIVYLATFICLSIPLAEIAKLPEWMFIAIILYGETIKRLLVFYRKYKGYELKLIRTLSFGILGITLSSILLCLSIVANHKTDRFDLPPIYYKFQFSIFVVALFNSAFIKVWLGTLGGEATLYTGLENEGG